MLVLLTKTLIYCGNKIPDEVIEFQEYFRILNVGQNTDLLLCQTNYKLALSINLIPQIIR